MKYYRIETNPHIKRGCIRTIICYCQKHYGEVISLWDEDGTRISLEDDLNMKELKKFIKILKQLRFAKHIPIKKEEMLIDLL
jgi:hypothetical protein